ncbi:MAG: hypothetical protein HGA33_06620, partial [Candidatus Moranbacteria bacterium]|nr:hypothetical protein [Candidatus Moranbacteria bacterium]
MNAHFVTSGYCGLLDSAIAKLYPIAVRNREITYEAATPSSVPQVFSVPEIMPSSFLSEDGGIAEMALMHLVMSGSIADRGDGFQVIPVGVSLFLEMEHQEEEIANLMTLTELVDALQKNGRKPIRYSLSVASQRQGFMSGFPPQTLLIESYAS